VSGVDARLVVGADGLLHDVNVAGVLSAADVHVAQRLGRLSGETDERVLLAVALAVRAVRAGSVCVSLGDAADVASAEAAATETQPLSVPWPELEAWESACRASPLVAVGVDGDPGRPVRWVDGRLYLDRYWRQEQVVRREMEARLAATADDVDVARLVEVLRDSSPRRRRRWPPPLLPSRG
jgi:exodeoxyribonuclease V alpha subunit